MLTEMLGKGGRVCQPAREGQLRCPLIVRPTSEDVITGQLFGVLQVLNPRWWLADFLNAALGERRFRRQYYRRLEIELWKNRPMPPRELLGWSEGSTQVDATIRWENPPTTVFVEVKYFASPSPKTANRDPSRRYPNDQVIRNIRVGLLECGWYSSRRLFSIPKRDFLFILLSPRKREPLIQKYQNGDVLRNALPSPFQPAGLPQPFIGELDYGRLISVLVTNRRYMTSAERRLVDQISAYLTYKLKGVGQSTRTQNDRQISLVSHSTL